MRAAFSLHLLPLALMTHSFHFLRYSTEIKGGKVDLFAFIEVDDRRNARTCHVFMCEAGQKNGALLICDAFTTAYTMAVEEAKKRAGKKIRFLLVYVGCGWSVLSSCH